MKKEITIIPRAADVNVESLIMSAIDKGMPVDTMERLLTMRRELKLEAAKEAYVKALGQFQRDCPVIKKTKKVLNKDGTLRYQFAPLDAIVDQIKKPVAENQLSYSWDVEHIEGHMKVSCKITHALGHSETSTLAIPIDKEGFMTAPQKYASAQTFAKRYTLCNALGVSTGDEDTDAVDVGKENDAKSVKAKIMLRLRTLKEKTDTRANIATAVKKLTQLDLADENEIEIASRLQTLIDESHEN